MTRTLGTRAGLAALTCVVALAGCAPSGVQPRSPGDSPTGSTTTPALEAAMRRARDLGPVDGTRQLSAALTLAGRDAPGVAALLAAGRHVSPTEWAQVYGPDPTVVARASGVLSVAGLTSSWHPGDVIMPVAGSAAAVQRFFGVAIDDFVSPDGSRFYAPLLAPAVPAALGSAVIAVTGMDDYRRPLTDAIKDPNGVSPADMTSFYDMTPLRSAGLDGTGMTVMFPEWAMPSAQVLASYATRFHLPPFNVELHTDAANWGAPATAADPQNYFPAAGEAALDIEVVHGIAPGAKEIVYALGHTSALPATLQTMFTQHPGAILSSSIGIHECEAEKSAAQDATAENAAYTAGAAQGSSIFWASGDRGAYGCVASQTGNVTQASVEPDASGPSVTAVGGTQVFLAANGAYFKEVAWGQPLEQWGSGGGVSTIFPRPSWQQAPGLDSSISGRAIPDVSANADIQSGWDVFDPDPNNPNGSEGAVGGTSAATPCWAAITALIDQDLSNKSLPLVGFANPALYAFAQSPSGLPAPAFHDITQGSNLGFTAAPGWDKATGLGSPDVSALTDDFVWYEQQAKGG